MYEAITYEQLLKRMLETVSKTDPKLDTREGSVVWYGQAPAALEMKNLYLALDNILRQTYADTASREYLIKRAGERGLAPYAASRAVLRGVVTPPELEIPAGTRFTLNGLYYTVTDKIAQGEYRLECESEGAAANGHLGAMLPVNYLAGLTGMELTELLIPGQEEEETEHFRTRYFESLNAQAFGGNVADYKEKINAMTGVGGVKVTPAWNGGGTVKLTIIGSDYAPPSATLVEAVQNATDPREHQGEGMGIAPIGHLVTVAGASAQAVDISTQLTYADGWKWEDVESYAHAAIDDYFKELAQAWAEEETALVVRISQIETRLLALSGVKDIAHTKIQGKAENLMLASEAIPVRGMVTDG